MKYEPREWTETAEACPTGHARIAGEPEPFGYVLQTEPFALLEVFRCRCLDCGTDFTMTPAPDGSEPDYVPEEDGGYTLTRAGGEESETS